MAVIDELTARVGEEIGVGDWVTVTQEQIDGFADATGDHQWIHVDRERAAEGPFGAPIAHGFLVLSLIPAIAPTIDLPVRMGINYGLDRVRFTAPVRVGSRLRARAVLRGVKEAAGGVQLKSDVTIEMEGSEKPACLAETITLLYP